MSAKRNYATNHSGQKNLSNLTSPTMLALGKKPLRLRSDELIKFASKGIEHATQLFSGRRHSGSGSTATRYYHVYVNACDIEQAMFIIKELLACRRYA